MGLFVNPGNDAFRQIRKAQIYVDKSGLLTYTNRVQDTPQKYICNSRPRRFGKSYTAEMLSAYYSKGCDSGHLFEDLDITQTPDYSKYLNHYALIYLDMQWFLTAVGKADNVVPELTKRVLAELREQYPSVDLHDNVSLPFTLAEIYEATGEKFVVIIDEWDALIRDAEKYPEAQEDYINFLRGLFKGSEPTKFIQLAYLTGILPIKRLKTQSALNDFDEFTMLYPGVLAPYIGFTAEEVRNLCAVYGREYEKVQEWYDGYFLNGSQIYNPRAVVSVMLTGEYRSYWSSTGTYESVLPYINMNFDGLKRSEWSC